MVPAISNIISTLRAPCPVCPICGEGLTILTAYAILVPTVHDAQDAVLAL